MAALIAVGGYLSLPLGPVPISLQTFFVMTAGVVLGSASGALAAALYLAAGLVGLPVFAGGTAGIAKLLGPTGGFLFSFVPMAMIAGIATRDRSRPLTWLQGLAWGTAATIVTFLIGVPWLKLALDWGWLKALNAGFLPFLPGAVVAPVGKQRRVKRGLVAFHRVFRAEKMAARRHIGNGVKPSRKVRREERQQKTLGTRYAVKDPRPVHLHGTKRRQQVDDGTDPQCPA